MTKESIFQSAISTENRDFSNGIFTPNTQEVKDKIAAYGVDVSFSAFRLRKAAEKKAAKATTHAKFLASFTQSK